jgi:MraZ protein
VFVGEYDHAVDTKGRMRMPSKFREELGDRFAITRGAGKCLFVFSLDEWQTFTDKLRTLPLTDAKAQAFTRLLLSGATFVDVDAQSRILIPQKLRDHAELTKDVSVLGVGNRIEIWSTDNWNKYSDDASENFDEVLSWMAQLGI